MRDIKSIYIELALNGRKNECAMTDTVFFPISQVCTRGVTLRVTLDALLTFLKSGDFSGQLKEV